MEELFSYFQPTCLKWGWEAAEVLIQVWDQYSVRIFKLFWLFYLYGMKLLKSFLRKLSKEKCQLHQVLHLRVRSGWQSPKGLLNSAKYWRGTKTMIQCKIRSNIKVISPMTSSWENDVAGTSKERVFFNKLGPTFLSSSGPGPGQVRVRRLGEGHGMVQA